MVRDHDSSESSSQLSDLTTTDQVSSSESDQGALYNHVDWCWPDDGGRDFCRCSYDYRGELDEIFCPHCRKEVQDIYESEESERWYQLAKTQIGKERDSDSTFDSWPSASEEEVVNKNGDLENFRRKNVVKKDLDDLTGNGSADDEKYDGDNEENERVVQKAKKLTKTLPKLKKRLTKTRNSKKAKPFKIRCIYI